MCGICGKYSPHDVDEGELQNMLQTLKHRGPDDNGVYVNGRIGLGNTRLSIIDIATGHQPICNEDQTIWVIHNGEIYNYKELRRDLKLKGHAFGSQSDTEVIVHLYEEFGEDCIRKLNGMFAFAIWDSQKQKLILARDHLGQKPLFYARIGDDFFFASEVKAILAARSFPREMDLVAVHHFLSLRFIPAPRTMLRHIRKLPPAHMLIYEQGRLSCTRYWNLSFDDKLKLSKTQFVDCLQEKMSRTVQSHLVSDVPVGAFLSGGMDSSMVVALMTQTQADPVKTFSIGVENRGFNELPFARMVAKHCHTDQIEEIVGSDIIKLLPAIIWHLDEPSDPIAACQYYAARLAARHVKVVLGGDGGDELFAGFDRYLGMSYIERYSSIPAIVRDQAIGRLLEILPESFSYKSTTQKLRWLHQVSVQSGPGERYAEATCFFRYPHHAKQALFSDEIWAKVGHLNSAEVITRPFYEVESTDSLDGMLYADIMTRLPEHSLMITDRMAMAHGLETRSPLVDRELMEFMAACPGHLKIRNNNLKYLLRELATQYLPSAIIKRQKQGFMFPLAYWLRNDLHKFVSDFLMSSYFVREGLFRKESVQRLVENHRKNRIDNHVRLWMLMNLEIWYQLYIEQRDLSFVTDRLHEYLDTSFACA